jgi:hypothetical protein
MKTLFVTLLFVFAASNLLYASDVRDINDKDHVLVILPFGSIGMDDQTILATQSLLEMNLKKATKWNIIAAGKTIAPTCSDLVCAIAAGKEYNANEAVLVELTRLGQKTIVRYALVDVINEDYLLQDNASSMKTEDLDVVMMRISESIVGALSFDESATVKNITVAEGQKSNLRQARYQYGLMFGYLYPQEGYDNDDRSFVLEWDMSYETNRMEIGAVLGARKGFVIDLYGNYQFSTSDYSPYLGGIFGFHWVGHDIYGGYYEPQTGMWVEDSRRGDAFELGVQAGFQAFRTYNFRLKVNIDYTTTFNDYDDRAITLTLGLLKGK